MATANTEQQRCTDARRKRAWVAHSGAREAQNAIYKRIAGEQSRHQAGELKTED